MRILIFNSFYMMLFGMFMIPTIDNPSFLAAFGFYHQNYFMTMCLYGTLWLNTAEILLRFVVHWIERRHEYRADAYSVRIGYGKAQYNALVRNFA